MKTKMKKKETSPSRFTRGEKVIAKSGRRHARKTAGGSASMKEPMRKMEELTPL